MNMPAPAKPKKIRRNQPLVFKETLAPTAPLGAPVVTPALPAMSDHQMRYALAAVWIMATILAGVGLGRIIAGRLTPTAIMPGLPVAQSPVNVAPVAATPDLAVLPAVTTAATGTAALAVTTPAASVNQATAGSPFQTAGTGWLQQVNVDLQPGFASFGHAQGNIGTTPVK
jgi:hypothetical protein